MSSPNANVPAHLKWKNPIRPRYVDYGSYLNPDDNQFMSMRTRFAEDVFLISKGEHPNYKAASQHKIAALSELYDQIVGHHSHWHNVAKNIGGEYIYEPSVRFIERIYQSDAMTETLQKSSYYASATLELFAEKGDPLANQAIKERDRNSGRVGYMNSYRKAIAAFYYAAYFDAEWIPDTSLGDIIKEFRTLIPHYTDIFTALSLRYEYVQDLNYSEFLAKYQPDKYEFISSDPSQPSDLSFFRIINKRNAHEAARGIGVSQYKAFNSTGDRTTEYTDLATMGELNSLWQDYLVDRDRQKSEKGLERQAYERVKNMDGMLSKEIKKGNSYAAHAAFYDAMRGKKRMETLVDRVVKKGDINANEMDSYSVYTIMAKFAAEVVPQIMRQTNGDLEAATTRVASILSTISDIGSMGLDRLKELNTGSFMDLTHSREKLFVEEQKNIQLNKNLTQAQSESKAKDQQLLIMQQQQQKLVEHIGSLKKSISDSEQHGAALLGAVQAQAARISYAACADHLRERLIQEGESIDQLDEFPTLSEVVSEIDQEVSLGARKIMAEHDWKSIRTDMPMHPRNDPEAQTIILTIKKDMKDKQIRAIDAEKKALAGHKMNEANSIKNDQLRGNNYEETQTDGDQKQRQRIETEKRLQKIIVNMIQAGLPDSQVIEIAQITADELAAIKEQQTRH